MEALFRPLGKFKTQVASKDQYKTFHPLPKLCEQFHHQPKFLVSFVCTKTRIFAIEEAAVELPIRKMGEFRLVSFHFEQEEAYFSSIKAVGKLELKNLKLRLNQDLVHSCDFMVNFEEISLQVEIFEEQVIPLFDLKAKCLGMVVHCQQAVCLSL